jgi:hypothetical protein
MTLDGLFETTTSCLGYPVFALVADYSPFSRLISRMPFPGGKFPLSSKGGIITKRNRCVEAQRAWMPGSLSFESAPCTSKGTAAELAPGLIS